MGLFRLLSTQSVMGEETFTMRQCWRLYDHWIDGERAELWAEPRQFGNKFREESNAVEQSPKRWSDAYLASFARELGLTLVTFDRALAGKAKGAVLLA
jgi:predicted nucleic acid-binding protein